MDEKKDQFKKAKNMFNSLKTRSLNCTFCRRNVGQKIIKFKRSKYETDKLFYKLVNLIDNKNIFNEDKAPTRADYVEKHEIETLNF